MRSTFFSYVFTLVFISLIHFGTSVYLFKTKYFETKLDHFNFNSNATFKLRYLINDTYWSGKRHAPIFFYTGNEGDITLFAQNTGFMWDIAPEFKALLVFAEHRYYGTSLPFGDKSKDPKNLGYLSSSQALMDYVELISFLKDNNDRKDHNPVVVFGGSYGGMLAAWMRMKYPGTVAGAIAASAPIWQFTGMVPCDIYNRVLTSAFAVESKTCTKNIRKSWTAITNVTSTDEGKSWLSKTWNTCSPVKNAQNVTTLKESYLSNMYSNLAMANYPYPANFLATLPAHPVKVFCSYFSEEYLDDKELLTALFKGISMYFNYTGNQKCFDYSTAYDQSLNDELWNYQACTEMVMPFCATGINDMLEPAKWNITEVTQECRNKYNVDPQVNLVKNLYGGKEISSVSNIIFSNGLLDPWSSGGVLRNVSQTAVAVIIPEAAHHLDLRAANPADPESVVFARHIYRHTIREWIQS